MARNGSFYLQVVGAFWYLLAIQRQDDCWGAVCRGVSGCEHGYLYCGNPRPDDFDKLQKTLKKVLNDHCSADGNGPFKFGIFEQALKSGVVASDKFFPKLLYCLWFGLQNLR